MLVYSKYTILYYTILYYIYIYYMCIIQYTINILNVKLVYSFKCPSFLTAQDLKYACTLSIQVLVLLLSVSLHFSIVPSPLQYFSCIFSHHKKQNVGSILAFLIHVHITHRLLMPIYFFVSPFLSAECSFLVHHNSQ